MQCRTYLNVLAALVLGVIVGGIEPPDASAQTVFLTPAMQEQLSQSASAPPGRGHVYVADDMSPAVQMGHQRPLWQIGAVGVSLALALCWVMLGFSRVRARIPRAPLARVAPESLALLDTFTAREWMLGHESMVLA